MPVNNILASEQFYRYRHMAANGHYTFLTKAYKCDSFFAGQQWEQTDLNMLQAQKRPAMTINKILSTISTIMGEQIGNRSEILFRPANGATQEVAEALTKVWMQIAQNNQLPWVRSDVFADGIIRSRGFYDVRLDFSDNMEGEVRITRLNSKNVLIDPDADDYDPDSWNDVITTKWLTPTDIELMYNKEDADYFRSQGESSLQDAYDSIDHARDRFAGPNITSSHFGQDDSAEVRRSVRVIERQYRKLDIRSHFVDVETGDTRPVPDGWTKEQINALLEKAGGSISVLKKQTKRIRWTVTADCVVLHDDWSPYKHFTVVPYVPHFRYGNSIGIVENLLGPQEILNKVSSQELHIVNTTANSGWKIRAGALKNMSIEDLEQSGAQTGIVLELDDVNNAEKITPNQTPTGLDRISAKSEDYIKSISAVSDSMQGFDREDVAAKAIAYKTQRGSVSMTKVLDNLERTDWILARNVLDVVQEYYTEERILNITHDDVMKEPETLEVNKMDPVTGEIKNDLTLGEYSIVITSQPYRATMEDSQFEQARALREIGVAIPDGVLIENSRLLRKADILKQMQGDSESPEAQAEAALQQRAKEAEVAKIEADIGDRQADTRLKHARASKEEQEAQGGPDAAAQTELQKAQMANDLEIQKMEREFVLKEQAQEREFMLKERAQEQELELKRSAHAEEMTMKREAAAQDALVKRAQAASVEAAPAAA